MTLLEDIKIVTQLPYNKFLQMFKTGGNMYIPNPDYSPGKPGLNNVIAIENQLTGGAQPLYGSNFNQSQTAYGPNFTAAQAGHSSNVVGDKITQPAGDWTATIGAEKAVPPDLLRKAGVSSAEDVKSASPSSQAKQMHYGIWQP